MVKKYLIALLVLLCAVGAQGAAYTSAASGPWSDPATWGGSGCPTNDADTFTIQAAHTVTFDCDLSSLANGLGAGVINGILDFDVGTSAWLKMNGNITGTGQWLMGADDDPITYTADNRPMVVIEQKGGTIQLSTAGNVKWYGLTNGFHAWATNTANIGDTNLFFTSDVSNVASNDVIYVSNPAVIGQAGSYHLVHSVETNRITVWSGVPSWAGLVTNSWPGTAIVGAASAANRTNAFVVKLSRPIVVYQPSRIANTGVFSSGSSNTISGVAFVNLARGAAHNYLTAWTFIGCAAVTCGNGGLAYGGNFHVAHGCVGAGNNAGIITSMSGGVMEGCVAANSSPGLSTSAYSSIFRRCIAVNNTGGGIVSSANTCYVLDCVGANNYSGGAINASMACSVYGGAYWGNSFGVAYLSGCSIAAVTISNSTSPQIAYGPSDLVLSHAEPLSVSEAFSFVSQRLSAPFTVVVHNWTNVYSAFGAVALTNWSDAQIRAHRPWAAAQHVPYYLDIAVKPSSVRSVEIGAWGKSDCYYSYAVTPAGAKPLGGTIPIATVAGQWNYVSAQITNTLPVPQSFRLWVSMTNAVSATEGWTRVNLPTDYTVRVQ